MNNFIINLSKDIPEIDIFGSIGEGWFEDGNTLKTVKADIKGITAKEIIVNVDSLGGSAVEAFAIHDLFRTHDAHITVNFVGWTASAGTLLAMGADKVNIGENIEFLAHNSWTVEIGNAEDLRNTADELDKIDDKQVRIYARKTGQKDSVIRDLMAEEKWINAEEAKEFGFIDEIIEPREIAASIMKDINNSKHLPKIKKMAKEDKTILETIKAEFTALKELYKGNKEEKDFNALIETKAEELNKLVNDSLAKDKDSQKEIETLNDKIKEVEASIVEDKTSIEAKDAEIKTLTEDLAKAKGIKTNAGGNGNAGDDGRKNKGGDHVMDAYAEYFKNKFN